MINDGVAGGHVVFDRVAEGFGELDGSGMVGVIPEGDPVKDRCDPRCPHPALERAQGEVEWQLNTRAR
jgi:hypothetical protein